MKIDTKIAISKWLLEHDHAITGILCMTLLLFAFVFSFITCAIIEYNNCSGSLSFTGYDFSEIIDFGLFRTSAITPTFECTKAN